MSIKWEIDGANNEVRMTANGVLTGRELLDYLKEVIGAEQLGENFLEIIDLSELSDFEIRYTETGPFREIWEQYRNKGCAAVLILAKEEVAFGTCRMIQGVIGEGGSEDDSIFNIFRNRPDWQKSVAACRKTKH